MSFSHRFVGNNQNPNQDPFVNLPKAAATYAVGGMSTHWTACTPREYLTERSKLIQPDTWNLLYKEAEKLLHTNQNMFDDTKIDAPGGGAPGGIRHFIRNHLVRDTLRKVYPDLKEDHVKPQYLPLAGVRRADKPEFITWSGADTVLGKEMLKKLKTGDTFQLKVNTSCIYMISSPQLAFFFTLYHVLRPDGLSLIVNHCLIYVISFFNTARLHSITRIAD